MLKKREILPPTVTSSRITLEEARAAVRAVYRNPATGKFVVGKRGESLEELRKRVRARNAARSSASRQR